MNQTGKQMIVTTALFMAEAVKVVVTSSTFGNLLLGVAGSYIANHIPVLNNVHFEMKVEKAYKRAVKKLAKEGVDDNLCSSLMSHDTLKQYAQSGMPETEGVLAQLFSLWINELHEDPTCSQYVVELKLDEVNGKLAEELRHIKGIEKTVEDINEYLHWFRTKGFCEFNEMEGYITRHCSEDEIFPGINHWVEDFPKLDDIVLTGSCRNKRASHLVLYSSMQMGKTTELKHLAFKLQSGGYFQPLYISVHDVPDLGFNDLPEDDMLNGRPFVLLIDAIDEAEGGKVTKAMQEVDNYAKHHPNMRIIVTCRTNFRRDSLLSSFVPLTLHPLSGKDVADYVKKVMPNDAEKILESINSKGIADIAKNPQDLKAMLEDYKNHGSLPDSRAELMEHIIESHYNIEKEKGFKTFPITKEEECRRLQKVAAIMMCAGRRELSEDEFRMCLNEGNDEMYEHMRYELVCLNEGKVHFSNNNVMEYLAASFLMQLDNIDAVKSLVCYNGTDKFRPLWYSCLLIWVDLLKLQSQNPVKQQFVQDAQIWMKQNARVLLYNSDLGLLTDDEKGLLVIETLERCKELDTAFDGVVNDFSLHVKRLPLNLIRYILEQWRTMDCVNKHMANIMRLTLALDWNALEHEELILCKELEDELYANLQKPLYEGKGKEAAYTALSNPHFFKDAFVKRFADIVSTRDGLDDMQSLTIRISGLDNVDPYTDYLLKVERDMISNYHTGIHHVVMRDYIYKALAKIAAPENVKKVIACIADDHYWRYQEKKETAEQTAEVIIERAKSILDDELAVVINQAQEHLTRQRTPVIQNWSEEQHLKAVNRERTEREMLCSHVAFVAECRSILSDPYRKGYEPTDILRLHDPNTNGRGDINRYVIEFLSDYTYTGVGNGQIIVCEESARNALNSDRRYELFRFLKLNEVKNNRYNVLPLSADELNLYYNYANNRLRELCANPRVGVIGDSIRIILELLINGELEEPASEQEWLALLSYAHQPLSTTIDELDFDGSNKIIDYVLEHVPESKVIEECHKIVTSQYARISFYCYNIYAKFLIKKKHRESLEFFLKLIIEGKNDADELLEMMIKKGCLIEYLKENHLRLHPVLKVDLCELLMADVKHHEWIREVLERIYSDYRYPYIKRRLSLLYRLGSDNALRLTLSNHHLLQLHDNPEFRYQAVSSIPLLAKMLNLCIRKGVFVTSINSILESLSLIAFSSEKALREVQAVFAGSSKIVKTLGVGCISPEHWAWMLEDRYIDHIQPVLNLRESKELVNSMLTA